MTFWTSRNITPKTKSRFVVKLNQFILKTVTAVTKPAVEVNTQEFKLINHYFNYPGLVKWQPITIKFVDMKGSVQTPSGVNPEMKTDEAGRTDTAKFLYKLLSSSGYATPRSQRAGAIAKNSSAYALNELIIQQITPGDRSEAVIGDLEIRVTEQWKLINPIIKSIKWGDLAYDSDDLVEYTMDIVYDYAEFSNSNERLAGGAINSPKEDHVRPDHKGELISQVDEIDPTMANVTKEQIAAARGEVDHSKRKEQYKDVSIRDIIEND